jgi:DNA-binding NarL/FixJ family response regulator
LLIPAVEQAQHGHVIISSNVRPSLRQIFSLALRVGLEPEDVKIIRCLQESLRDRDIADKLGYSEEGVSGRLRKMFKSYGMHSRDELANWFRDFVDPILRFDQ